MNKNNLIEILESKLANPRVVTKVANYLGTIKEIDIEKSLDFIYNIFNYIGISDEQIENILFLRTGILALKQEEIVKIAYVLQYTGLINELLSKPSYIKSINNYKRIFMRHTALLNNNGYNNKYSPGISFLTVRGNDAYVRFYIPNFFGESVMSDERLEEILNSMLKIGDKPVSVDEYINKNAWRFYNKYLLYQKTNHKEGMSK